ncbi:DUF4118 domain-containing protein [Geobacter sp. DSM 9736]|uniref:DUF4118 domain-containing protein n=1 Tax=Geobacter sp. DSM 9736 TaxID=1277350 RepID=UPI000B504B3F|nr:DUF4118 domain-containing protein [Geobacter sp. DSM 9736]SNB47518.1 two-component system, OmpR family, sensor histidine kinase KdpD [Geobacter sp. DSM 9736]
MNCTEGNSPCLEALPQKESRSIPGLCPEVERLMVCISGSPFSERLIRITHRLAVEMKVPWTTMYVETPSGGRHQQENRERVWKELRLAESLGADVATVTASSVADAAIGYAKRHSVTKIVVGKPRKPRWREFLRQPLVDQLIRLSGVIDVYVVSIEPVEKRLAARAAAARRQPVVNGIGYLKSLLLVAASTAAGEVFHRFIEPTNLVMLYLLAVVLAAVRLGLKPAMATAFLSILAFDFFFVPPRFTFAVSDKDYLITFASLLSVGVVISRLVTKVKEQAVAVREREVQTASLYHLSRDLAAAANVEAVVAAVIRNIAESLEAKTAILLPDGERLRVVGGSPGFELDDREIAVADRAFRNGEPTGCGTETLNLSEALYLVLQTPGRRLGVMGVKLAAATDYAAPQIRRLLEAFATQTAMALERVELSHQAEQAQVLEAREKLERALLNSVSHDLRTPLVSITGALTTLKEEVSLPNQAARGDLLDAALEEAERLNRFVGNLLDMTRLEAGELKLKEELVDVEDLVGCALAPLGSRLEGRKVEIMLSSGLPLVKMDMAFMTQVLVNLLDNAVKYSPMGTPLQISAGVEAQALVLAVADRGPGVPEADLDRIFGKFYRVPVPEGKGGTGLGLSICKGIVEAHGGTIKAENRDGGGLLVVVKLPL